MAGARVVALIGLRARDREGRTPAGAVLARLPARAGIAVVAGGTIRPGGIGASASGGIAGAGDVALVGGRADDGVAAGADPALAGVGLRAGVAVDAGGAVAGVRVGALAGGGVAGAGDVALVGGRADDRAAAGAEPVLAGVGLRAGVAVAARGTIGLDRMRAVAGGGVAGAGGVTLVGGS